MTDGVTLLLNELYPDSAIYVEQIEQKLIDRSFLVSIIDSEINKGVGNCNTVTGKVSIVYFLPKSTDNLNIKEANNVFSNIAFNMQTVKFGDVRIRLTGFNKDYDDDVLTIVCNFKCLAYFVDESVNIETIDIEKG